MATEGASYGYREGAAGPAVWRTQPDRLALSYRPAPPSGRIRHRGEHRGAECLGARDILILSFAETGTAAS